MFLYPGFESGQHVEILPMFSIALDSRVVNMLRLYKYVLFFLVSRVVNMLKFNEDVLLFWIGAWSTCRDSTRVFYCLGFESGQHVEIRMTTFYYSGFESCRCVDVLLLCSSILNSRVVNMLTTLESKAIENTGRISTC